MLTIVTCVSASNACSLKLVLESELLGDEQTSVFMIYDYQQGIFTHSDILKTVRDVFPSCIIQVSGFVYTTPPLYSSSRYVCLRSLGQNYSS